MDSAGAAAPSTYPVTALTNGSSVEVDGLTFSLSGPMARGDSFTVKPVEGAGIPHGLFALWLGTRPV